MRSVCILDTSVFAELLEVFGRTRRREKCEEDLRAKIEADESLFLPMATIFETGNHIGQLPDGGQRRSCAERFATQVSMALEGRSPFNPVHFVDTAELLGWISGFPEKALRGVGFGDMSIIADWERLCRLNTGRRVYVWSFDEHLIGYDRPPEI